MRKSFITRTAKSAKAQLAVALFSALVALAATGVIFGAAAAKPGFKLTATPATQTVTQGQAATYGIAIARDNKFTGEVGLQVTGVPASAATFNPNPVPGAASASSLAVDTTTLAAATYSLTISGTSGSGSATTTVTLVVLAPNQPSFSLTASPASRVISDDDSVGYSIGIARAGGFDGQVSLSASGVPKDLSATFSPASTSGSSSTLTITSPAKPKPGTYTVTVTGTGGGMTRAASVRLTVEEKRAFQISGDADPLIGPGDSVPVDLFITNPHNFPLVIQDIGVSVDGHTTSPGCSGSQNFSVVQIPGASYPITLPAGGSASLGELGVTPPRIVMNDLTTNQDACKGVGLDLRYSGIATK